MPQYEVETLVHLNIRWTIEAEDGEAAMTATKTLLEAAYPEAALVDVVNYESLACPKCGSEDRNRTGAQFYLLSGIDCDDAFHAEADIQGEETA